MSLPDDTVGWLCHLHPWSGGFQFSFCHSPLAVLGGGPFNRDRLKALGTDEDEIRAATQEEERPLSVEDGPNAPSK
jgi:hypothetical protein